MMFDPFGRSMSMFSDKAFAPGNSVTSRKKLNLPSAFVSLESGDLVRVQGQLFRELSVSVRSICPCVTTFCG